MASEHPSQQTLHPSTSDRTAAAASLGSSHASAPSTYAEAQSCASNKLCRKATNAQSEARSVQIIGYMPMALVHVALAAAALASQDLPYLAYTGIDAKDLRGRFDLVARSSPAKGGCRLASHLCCRESVR